MTPYALAKRAGLNAHTVGDIRDKPDANPTIGTVKLLYIAMTDASEPIAPRAACATCAERCDTRRDQVLCGLSEGWHAADHACALWTLIR